MNKPTYTTTPLEGIIVVRHEAPLLGAPEGKLYTRRVLVSDGCLVEASTYRQPQTDLLDTLPITRTDWADGRRSYNVAGGVLTKVIARPM